MSEFYTSKEARQPRMPITSRIQTGVVCPHCQAAGRTGEGPNFVLSTQYNRRCGRCLQEIPEDPDLPVHDSMTNMLSALFNNGFQVREFLEETGVACGNAVRQHIVKLHRNRQEDQISASVRWFELERPAPIVGVDWSSLLPYPGRFWSMGFGDKLLNQGLPSAIWSICQQACYTPQPGAFKVTERQLKPQHLADELLFFRLEHRSHLGIIPGVPHENVILVVRAEFTWAPTPPVRRPCA